MVNDSHFSGRTRGTHGSRFGFNIIKLHVHKSLSTNFLGISFVRDLYVCVYVSLYMFVCLSVFSFVCVCVCICVTVCLYVCVSVFVCV